MAGADAALSKKLLTNHSAQRHAGAALAFAAVTCALAPVAFMSMFSVFRAYDDEGSFLITLRDYLSGHSLFTQVFTIYGPLFYELTGGLFKLFGLEPSHDSGRFMTLAFWLTASLVGGLAVYRLTRNPWLGLSAQFVTFRAMVVLVNEPMHPSGLVSVLLMCLVAAAAFRSTRPRATAVFIGAIVGGLCMVKINVGAFAAGAVAFAFAGSLTHQWRRFLLPLIAVLVAALPPVLMASLLSRDWVLEYAVVVALAAATVGLACVAAPPRPVPPSSGAWLAAGGMVVVIACVFVALAGGTDFDDLFTGTVVVAFRLPQLFVWPVSIGPVGVLWAALSLAVAIATFRSRAKMGIPAAAAGVVRVSAGLLTWLSILLLPTSLFMLALPLAWVATQKPRDDVDDPTGAYARLLLPAVAVLESLQAYPVAGTQLSLAALTLVPVGAITLSDGIRQLRLASREARLPLRIKARWLAPAALLVNIAFFLLIGFEAASGFAAGTPLSLPGAESLRVPAQQASELRALVGAINRDCSSFITFPGMTSLYLWTGQKPPVPLYAGVWMYVLDNEQQQSFVQQLQDRSRLCVVKDQAVIDFWAQGRQVPSRPLVDFIDTGFVDGATYGEYELLVRR